MTGRECQSVKCVGLTPASPRPLHRLSFAGTMERFQIVVPYLFHCRGRAQAVVMYRLLLSWIASDLVPDRPHRIEPRAIKRRPKTYDLLNRPRKKMRKTLLR
jgi:hypothetical protein